jgi:carbamoyltransferase
MLVLGINAPPVGWHDASACLVEDGRLLAFVEEERLSRKKHALHGPGPHLATAYCLGEAGREWPEVDVVAIGWDMPLVSAAFGGSIWRLEDTPAWLRAVLGWPVSFQTMPEVRFVPHHLAHATVSFYASDFDAASVLVTDGNGDDESISMYRADRRNGVFRTRVWPRGHSVGWMYDAACEFVGLDFLEAGKLMGLASYGQAAGVEPWELLPDAEPSPPAELPEGYHYREAVECWKAMFARLGGGAIPRCARADLDQDVVAVKVAWSAQYAVETALRRLADTARALGASENLCLGGGVALNCKANGLLDGPLYSPPVPHDAGIALGAAWHVAPPRGKPADLLSPFLGPEPIDRNASHRDGLRSGRLDLELVCEALEAGCVGAIAEGRGEVGPRALGHRSIVAAPGLRSMRDKLNTIKGREPWRPFGASAFPAAATRLWDDRPPLTRYMLAGTPVNDEARTVIPAAVHIDGTTRPQVVSPTSEEILPRLLRVWGERTGGALINTSFNSAGEPIVSSTADAIRTFRAMELDFLILGEELLTKRRRWWNPKEPSALSRGS